MNALVSPAHDRTLGDALAGIVGDLRSRRLGSSKKELERNVRGTADRFVGRLAVHFRYTEEFLFPGLRELRPGTAPAIEGMEKGHRLLKQYLRDLAGEIKIGSDEGIYDVARSFLATLLDHLHRETAMLGGIVGSLDDLQARRLNELLAGGRSIGFVTPEGEETGLSAFAKGLLEPKEAGVTKEAKEGREAARRGEDPFASSDNQEEREEDES